MSIAKGKRQGAASCAGRSLIEILWDALMDAYAELMSKKEALEAIDGVADPDRYFLYDRDVQQVKGECLGLARAVALVTNPYYVNIDAVREEAAARWETMSST